MQQQHQHPRFVVTGKAAHSRIVPLLPKDWIDCTSNEGFEDTTIDFLFENAPRYQTKAIRDTVKVYSHLPNGILLDDKWALARLTCGKQQHLESHCFRGQSGFCEFAEQVGLLENIDEFCLSKPLSSKSENQTSINDSHYITDVFSFPPFIDNDAYRDTWVIKDANSNGAGGIWIVSKATIYSFKESLRNGSTLIEGHRYIAQKYAFPPLLWYGRKLHVRCYAVITSYGSAYVHHKAFLHVANENFDDLSASNVNDQRVHITNCCSNSDDSEKFVGEICVDFEDESSPEARFLSSYFLCIKEVFKDVATSFFPFIGGAGNGGFEYLGLDFILSSTQTVCTTTKHLTEHPSAHLLEINAPPSQDTATGLSSAENLHNEVLQDLVKMWIEPLVLNKSFDPTQTYGWRCVIPSTMENTQSRIYTVPSRHTFLNKFKWASYERKALSNYSKAQSHANKAKQVIRFTRTQFPFYSEKNHDNIFLENAGGTQVPRQVITSMESSLKYRDRSVTGLQSKERARELMYRIMKADQNTHSIVFGKNASSLLMDLALYLTGIHGGNKALSDTDEIVIYKANHEANIKPWLVAAQVTGAKIIWWESPCDSISFMTRLKRCLSPATKILAIPHASNILGYCYNIAEIKCVVNSITFGRTQIVVDGVSFSPHRRPDVVSAGADWYVLSTHKLFGPHAGVLCGLNSRIFGLSLCNIHDDTNNFQKVFENGTTSYEVCNGICGIGTYFADLAASPLNARKIATSLITSMITEEQINVAYQKIQSTETMILDLLLCRLSKSPRVHVLEEIINENKQEGPISCKRLPIVSFVHESIPPRVIVSQCRNAGVIIRNGSFLSSRLLQSRGIQDTEEGVTRISLSHYNSFCDVEKCMDVLESIDSW